MFKTKYKSISYFDFAVLVMGVINYLNKRDLPAKLKTQPDIPFLTTSMIDNYGVKVRNQIPYLQRHNVNSPNMLVNYLKHDIITKEILDEKDKELLAQCNISHARSRFKFNITTKAIKLVDKFNNTENHALFPLYDLSARHINVLCSFIVEDSDLTESEILAVLINNKIQLRENMSCYEATNKLAIKGLICKKPRDEEKTKYHITDLGRSVLNLVLDMDEALAVEEKSEHKVFEINTPYKTVLAFPLSWK